MTGNRSEDSGCRYESPAFSLKWWAYVLSDRSKILNNEQLDNGITLKSKIDNAEKLFIS